jgi:UDP-N-acetylglucosamine--N-acetylmuramyl-(pentapeptide) pyrophosphoryl-undecaprenol N-acetylglucosamine transferase
MIKILFVCGGTGGHIFPALAIASVFKKEPDCEISFAGRKESMEEKLVSEAYPFHYIRAVPLVRRSVIRNLLLPAKLFLAILDGLKIIRKLNPDFIIATGGYVSLPVVLAGAILKCPVYIQEQNAVAGLANKIGGQFAKRVYVTSDAAQKLFKPGLAYNLGNPVRSVAEVNQLKRPAEIPQDKSVILVLGGSQGAQGINRKIDQVIHDPDFQDDFFIVWQVGSKNYSEIKERNSSFKNVLVCAFLDEIYAWMNVADVIVSRAGASTIAEILALEKPSILLPFPWATANHQEHNARVLERAGAAYVELDDDPNGLLKKIRSIVQNENQKRMMTKSAASLSVKDAADRIVSDIKKLEKLK